VKARPYSEEEFFRADGAEGPWPEVRKKALDRLAVLLQAQYAKSIAWGLGVRDSLSDLRFTDANRMPFPFVRLMRQKFDLCSVVTASDGPKLRDLDDHWTLDVSGSYGVNVAGYERYKAWMQQGWERVKALGPVLGPLHPLVADNIAWLKSISNTDEVSFHMSGTEAVMAAVRLARFNTRRQLIVCFAGSYHGWWDGVQPGLGSERDLSDCLTLKDMHPAALDVIRWRAGESGAGIPPQLAASQRRGAADQWHPEYAGFDRSLCPVVAPITGGVQRVRRPLDLRRGVLRVSPRTRWGTGLFWRAGGYRRLWQDGGRGHAHRRCVWEENAHAAF
jgi:hypothetical protein